MSTKKLLVGLMIVAGTVLTPVASQARSDIDLGFTFGPTAAPVTAIPAAYRDFAPAHGSRDGYRQVRHPGSTWVPGHWEGRGRHRHFVQGHWVRAHRAHGRYY
jgi:hypothetical protein